MFSFNMSTRINKHKPFSQLILTASKKQQKALLSSASPEQVKVRSEILLNLLSGNITISGKSKQLLRKHKDKIRELANRKSSVSTLKRLWNQFPLNILEHFIKSLLNQFFS